jgi:hypothetical protein
MLKPRHIWIVLALLLALIGDSWGQSHRPAPRGGKTSQPKQSQTQPSQQPPGNEQRGTDQAPFTIKIIPTQKTDAEANAAEQHSNEETAVERWLTNYTGLVALFTFLLFGAATAQVLVLISQLRHLATQAGAMVTVESPVPELSDIKLVQYQNWNSPQTVPDIFGMEIDRIPPGPIPDFCRVLVYIKNFGRSSMHITSFCMEKRVYSNLPEIPDYKNTDNSWQPWLAPYDGLWLMPGDALIAVRLTDDEKADIQAGRATFWVYGFITYLNVSGVQLMYKFLARWDLTKGFIREKRKGYEN